VNQTTGLPLEELDKVVSSEELLKFQSAVRTVAVGEEVTRYAVSLTRATRPTPSAQDFVAKWVAYGSSLRASQYLVLGGKARAILAGRYNVSVEDIQALAKPVLRHRIITNFHAESEKVTTDDIVARLLETVPLPQSGLQ
jgi:MoxR-like ATPase